MSDFKSSKISKICTSKVGILFALGIVFIIGGSVFLAILPQIIEDKINKEMRIINGTYSYERFQETKVPLKMKFHFFHLNNSQTYKNLDDIELIEKGPYVYRETRFKPDITKFNEDLLTYHETFNYMFIGNNNLDENEEITLINIPALGVLQNKMLDMGPNIFSSVYDENPMPNETSLFITSRVVDILFNGIESKLFQFITDMDVIKVPEKFSIFITKSNSNTVTEAEKTIYSGHYNINKLGETIRFDNKYSLINEKNDFVDEAIWPYNNTKDHNCTELKGTDGSFFTPDISKHDTLYVFEPQICRTVSFKYWKETEVRDINTYRFRIPDNYFQSPFKNPKNWCYCLEEDSKKCDKNGRLELSRCFRKTFGVPVVMSAPYFNHADEDLRTQFKYKLKPKKALNDKNYGSYLDVEPMTGVTLKAVKRVQINLKVKRADYNTMPKLKESEKDEYIIPILWLEESGEVDDYHAYKMKKKFLRKREWGYIGGSCTTMIGILMIISSIYMLFKDDITDLLF